MNWIKLAAVTSVVLSLIACGGGDENGNVTTAQAQNPQAVCTGSGTPLANPIVYFATMDGVQSASLFVTDADNPSAGSFRLNTPLSPGQAINSYALSPDNRCVIYISDERFNGQFELFSVDIANPGKVARLNPVLTQNKDVTQFTISPDGSQVLYLADQDQNNVNELYLVDINAPGIVTKINSPLVTNGGVSPNDFRFSPDGTKILYTADQRTDGLFELFLVNKSAPGISSAVNPPFASFVTLSTGTKFSPDGNWIGYVADQDNDEVAELYLVNVSDPGVSSKLNPAYTNDQDICTFRFSPDSLNVAYCAIQDTTNTRELYTVSLASPGVSVKLNPTLVDGGNVRSNFRYSTDSSFIIYIADQDIFNIDELYRVSINSPGITEKLSTDFLADGDVSGFEIRADDLAVAYVADQHVDDVSHLYQVDIASPGTSQRLNPSPLDNDHDPFAYNADGTRIFYIADESVAGKTELFHVDVAVPQVSTRLNAVLDADGKVESFKVPQ